MFLNIIIFLLKFNTPFIAEVAKKLGEEWKNVDPKVRSDLSAEFEKDKEAFDIAKLKYAASLTTDQKEALELMKYEIAEEKKKRQLKQVKFV